jgi:hypothetical protein
MLQSRQGNPTVPQPQPSHMRHHEQRLHEHRPPATNKSSSEAVGLSTASRTRPQGSSGPPEKRRRVDSVGKGQGPGDQEQLPTAPATSRSSRACLHCRKHKVSRRRDSLLLRRTLKRRRVAADEMRERGRSTLQAVQAVGKDVRLSTKGDCRMGSRVSAVSPCRQSTSSAHPIFLP